MVRGVDRVRGTGGGNSPCGVPAGPGAPPGLAGLGSLVMGFGMEEMIKGQLKSAIDTGNAALKKAIEG